LWSERMLRTFFSIAGASLLATLLVGGKVEAHL
jgi:hypothetical protein